MSDAAFDLPAYLSRIGLAEPPPATLAGLGAVIAAHATSIPFENIDVLLGRPPQLDPAALQAKMLRQRRGGYCFEQNGLLRLGLRALGFDVTGRLARVVRGMAADAPRFATHMTLLVTLQEGAFIADVGFGNLTPTAPIALVALIEQPTPHETMRLLPVGSELVLQARLRDRWENLWRLCEQVVLDPDYEVANWFTATHPASPFVGHMIAARSGPDGARYTLLNGRASRRLRDGTVERRALSDGAELQAIFRDEFHLDLPIGDVHATMERLAAIGRRGAAHAAFAD